MAKMGSDEWRAKISATAKARGIGKWMKGRKWNPEALAKRSAGMKGHPAYNWAGERPGYSTLHRWLSNKFGSASKYKCQNLNCQWPFSKRMEYALVRGLEYERKRENFLILCVRCHRRYDKGLMEVALMEACYPEIKLTMRTQR